MAGTAEDIPLRREDVISISSIFDLKEEFQVTISGEIRRAGQFKYYENMSLEELIILAGGLTISGSNQRIEIARRVINDNQTATSATAKTAQIFQIDVNKVLTVSDAKFVLQPFDIITIRTIPGYEVQKQIRIDGEVLYPGYYTIIRKNERISDLIKRAGGLTELAYTDGASLKRAGTFESQLEGEKETQKLQQFKKIQENSKDDIAVTLDNVASRNSFVGINLSEIINKPGSKKDLFLEDGDILSVPKELQTVKVSGEVLYANTVIYTKTKSFKQYITNAGGFGQNALKGRSYIIYANGSVRSTKKFLVFNNYPIVKTGSEIFVPKGVEKRKLTAAEIVGITSGLASFGAIVLGVMNLLN
jgi:protein involved in polysaccharide export with SLBB domain